MLKCLTQNQVKEILDYNPMTGIFTWKARPRSMFGTDVSWRVWNAKHATTQAGTDGHGYRIISCFSKRFQMHRLAWLFMHGEWPAGCIDHINHDPSDNRIENLRVVSNDENQRNREISSNNTSGATGVRRHRGSSRWEARIGFEGKFIYLGIFLSKQKAIEARKKAETKFGFHKNHGEPMKVAL